MPETIDITTKKHVKSTICTTVALIFFVVVRFLFLSDTRLT